MPAEIELKYSLTSAHTMEHMIKDELIQHYIKDPFKQSESRSDYYDTQDWTLSEHDFALRVTMLSNMQVAVLKKGNFRSEDVKGLYRGSQWYSPFSGTATIVEDLMDRGAPAEFRDLMEGKSLEPCFYTQLSRNKNTLYLPDRTRVEISFDIGELVADGKHMPLYELGLELLYGSEELLINYSEQLTEKFTMTPVLLTKQERALRFLRSRS